jgi:hypothetical protein
MNDGICSRNCFNDAAARRQIALRPLKLISGRLRTRATAHHADDVARVYRFTHQRASQIARAARD